MRLAPRKHTNRAQFSASIVIFKSAKPYGLTLSGRYPASGAEAAHLVPGAPDSINRLRFYLPPFVRRRSHELPFSCWKRAAYSAFSFSSHLSALRNTHNPSELHGKRWRSAYRFNVLAHFRAGAMPFAHGGSIPLLEPDTRIELAHTAWRAVGLPLT